MKFALAFLICMSYLRYGESCHCSKIPVHPQSAVCNSDFVIKAKVLKKYVEGDKRLIIAKVKKDFTSMDRQLSGEIKIYTPKKSKDCGEYFRRKTTYIISGSIVDGRLTTDSCKWNKRYSKIRSFQKKALYRKIYRNNCQCKVINCEYGDCQNEGKDGCAIKSNFSCFSKTDVCVRTNPYNPSCQWLVNRC